MLHKVFNHAEHDFHMARSTPHKNEKGETVTESAMPWIIIPRAGLRSVEKPNLQTGKVEKVREFTPGEAVLDDDMLAAIKKSEVGKHWLRPEPRTNKPQVVIDSSYPAPESAEKAA